MDRDTDGSDTTLGHVLKVSPQEGTKGEGEDEDEPGLLRLPVSRVKRKAANSRT
eukprot:CAMPEP_0185464564 /NCGR_PEP_ID=MMETSP1365-20130426/95792_1 /TAXON_ID=38817 /ORGANISM="Gephyrocapsa oceanica, Strain RCC1303" /LENGTH=53 /DNA_ID=CAMNT_0028071303 /DNA_START=105 /DNA_END=266 /DNA_ORIENTATION=-